MEHATCGTNPPLSSPARPEATNVPPPAPTSYSDRNDWTQFADELLLAVRPYFTPSRAKAHLPGATSISGYESDGLEGYARTFLLAGMRLVGENGHDPHGLIPWYRSGLIAGTTPNHPDRWPTLPDCAQAKVEAASIALMLDYTRPWIWDTLSAADKANVVAWLTPAVGDDSYHHNNWRWFRIVVQTFLRSVGAEHSPVQIHADLAEIETFYREEGWYSDGQWRSYDHYVGWAMHLYPILWRQMRSAADFLHGPDGHGERHDRQRLARFLEDFICLVGRQGAPLYIGRSLIYRFALIAPVWAGVLASLTHPTLGQLRRCANLILTYFRNHAVPNAAGLLDMGWHGQWLPMRQSYSGPGSPYWASKGLLGVALEAEHPVWQTPEEPLPAETKNQLRIIKSPGWIVSATTDGIVRVTNHGTDRGYPRQQVGDLPEYARWGYSNVTTPLLDAQSRQNPLDQAVVILARHGATHRAGFELTDLGLLPADRAGKTITKGEDVVAYAASRALAHWMTSVEVGDFGLPMTQVKAIAGELDTVSIVRGPWEIRLARFTEVPGVEPDEQLQIRFGGWPLSGASQLGPEATAKRGGAGPTPPTDIHIEVDKLHSRLTPIPLPAPLSHTTPDQTAGASAPSDSAPLWIPEVDERTDASPLGRYTYTPTLTTTVAAQRWYAVGLYLGNEETTNGIPPTVRRISTDSQSVTVSIAWADLTTTVKVNICPQTPASGLLAPSP